MIKSDAHIFGGMQRDRSVSKQSPEFLWDALNIRMTARDGDTLLSITNERGTSVVKDSSSVINPTFPTSEIVKSNIVFSISFINL